MIFAAKSLVSNFLKEEFNTLRENTFYKYHETHVPSKILNLCQYSTNFNGKRKLDIIFLEKNIRKNKQFSKYRGHSFSA